MAVLPADAARSADNVSVRAKAAERFLVDDNIRLQQNSPGWVFGSTTSLDLDVDAKTPLAGINLNLGADYSHFAGPGASGDLNSFDWLAGLGANRRFVRTELGARAEYQRQAVRESELEDTGETQGGADRVTVLGRATAAYDVSNLDRVDATVQVRDVSFEGGQSNARRNPFVAASATARWAKQVSERGTGTASLASTFFDSDDAARTQSQAVSLAGLYEYRQSPRLRWRAGAGAGMARQERDDFAGGRDSTISPTLSLDTGLIYMLERTTFELSFAQDVQPSALGSLRQERAIQGNFRHRATSTVTLALSAQHTSQRSDAKFSPFGSFDRDYSSAEGRLSWRFLPDWRFTTGYRFRHADDDDGSASSHAVFATLSYGFTLLP